MSIKSPISYADWYWKHSVDAQARTAELVEQETSPLIKALLADVLAFEELPDGLRFVLESFAEPTGQQVGVFGGNMLGEVLGNAVATVLEQPLKKSRYSMGKLFLGERIDAPTTALLWQRRKITEEMYKERYEGLGYPEDEFRAFYTAQQPYPTIPDIMLWARYHVEGAAIKENVWKHFDVSEDDYDIWNWHTLQRLTTVQVQNLFKWKLLPDIDVNRELTKIGWSDEDIPHIKNLSYLIPNAMLQVQGGLMQGADERTILEAISKADIHPTYNKVYYDAVLTKPSSQDIISYELRQDPSLSVLKDKLRKVGIHPDYSDLYKELAYPIPPVADLVTMAVREAFSPTIAAKFGQYEDFPKDFEQYAGMKGISKEWAERYWAAHWNLPSPQQGFEMLHRGKIDRSELDMLLRAQDVMPFWRDKLTEIAYRPLTRVDVRRMYKVGVLDEGEVYEAYLDVGYEDENARRMAEFTIKQTLATQSKFTSGDIVKAFTKRMISSSDAVRLLTMIDVRNEDARRIVETAEYKREWAFTEQQIKGIRNLYKKRMFDENESRDKLSRLNLPADQINVLMQQWHYEKVDELDATWTTAQTLKFLKAGLINEERAKRELFLNGYDDEHINVYMESIK